jgi:hypothetical protein
MKKLRRRGVQKEPQRQTEAPEQQPPQVRTTETSVRDRSLRDKLLAYWLISRRWGGRLAKAFAVLSSIGSFLLLITPKVTIQPSVVLHPKYELGTLFAVTNTGHVPALNVAFSCKAVVDQKPKRTTVYFKPENLPGLERVRSLWPGQTATRSCVNSILGLDGDVAVDIFVSATWLWEPLAAAHFVAKKGDSGYFLVPDIER